MPTTDVGPAGPGRVTSPGAPAARLEALSSLSHALIDVTLNLDAVLELTVRRVSELIGDACVIRLVSEDSVHLELVASYHPLPAARKMIAERMGAAPQRVDEGFVAGVLSTGEPHSIPLMTEETARAVLKPEYHPYIELVGFQGIVTVPLRVRDSVIGVMQIVRDRGGPPYTPDDETFLLDLADRAALAIENARLHEQLEAERSRVAALNAALEARVAERTAALAAANAELEEFCHSVSHDLRSPLHTIDGFGLALAEDFGDVLGPEGADFLDRIRTATQRMGHLIDDLLRLSRVSRGELRVARVDMSMLVELIIDEISGEDFERDVEWRVAPGLEATADPSLLRIALENLLRNAWKFTRRVPRGVIEFGAKKLPGGAAYYVRDNGVGFDPRYKGKLFGTFQRLHSDAEFEGTGVGLATVKRVVERHGGHVWAEGHPGEGATFWFTLGAGEAAAGGQAGRGGGGERA